MTTPSPNSGAGPLKSSMLSGWEWAFGIAVAVASVIVALKIPEPSWHSKDGDFWLGISRFSLVLEVLIVLLLMAKFRQKKHTYFWILLSALGLVIGLAALLGYFYCSDQWVCTYSGQVYVIGTNLTDVGKHYLQSRPYSTAADLIAAAAGTATSVWPANEIAFHRMDLVGLYLLIFWAFGLFILAASQSVKLYCK